MFINDLTNIDWLKIFCKTIKWSSALKRTFLHVTNKAHSFHLIPYQHNARKETHTIPTHIYPYDVKKTYVHNYYLCMRVFYFACYFSKNARKYFSKILTFFSFIPQGRELLFLSTKWVTDWRREGEREISCKNWFMEMHDRMQIRPILILWNIIDSFIAPDTYISKQKNISSDAKILFEVIW